MYGHTHVKGVLFVHFEVRVDVMHVSVEFLEVTACRLSFLNG